MDGWIKKTHTHTQWNSNQPLKIGILPFAITWMNFDNVMPSKMLDKEGQILRVISFICGIFLI